jgi:AraC family transcriptional regulator
MKFSQSDYEILNKLVGRLNETIADKMNDNLECYLHPKVSLFVPSRGYCDYALTANHTHPSYSFIYYFQPVSDIIYEGRHRAYDLAEGKCLSATSPGILHQEIEGIYFQSYIAIVIDSELFQEIIAQYSSTVPIFRGEIFKPHSELLGLLRCFMLEAVGGRNEALLDHLAFVIAHLIVQSILSVPKSRVPLYDRFEIDQAITYMNSHIAEKITVEDLAAQANISSGHFSKLFKKITGNTPIEFLTMLRLHNASIMLMNPEENVTDIAMKCGFSSPSYFSTCFTEKYHMTPSAYRHNLLRQKESQDIDK